MRTIEITFFVLAAGCAGVKEAPIAMVQTDPMIVDPALHRSAQDRTIAAELPRPEAKEEVNVVMAPHTDEPHQIVMNGDDIIEFEPVNDVPMQPISLTAVPAEIFTPPVTIELPPKNEDPLPVVKAAPPPVEVPAEVFASTVTIEQPPKNEDPLPVVKAAPPPVEVPAEVFASTVTIEQPPKNEDPPPVAEKTEPPLDVAALKARLRDTKAIGAFTKIALKNQMDDLMQQFRAYHQGGEKTSVTSLRQPYDMLVLKLLAVVQDGDPSLAHTISVSREAIWSILADRETFNLLA